MCASNTKSERLVHHVINPLWHRGWMSRENWLSNMITGDVLGPFIAKSSAGMLWNIGDKEVLVVYKAELQLYTRKYTT